MRVAACSGGTFACLETIKYRAGGRVWLDVSRIMLAPGSDIGRLQKTGEQITRGLLWE
jgi:hypothetical protein